MTELKKTIWNYWSSTRAIVVVKKSYHTHSTRGAVYTVYIKHTIGLSMPYIAVLSRTLYMYGVHTAVYTIPYFVHAKHAHVYAY